MSYSFHVRGATREEVAGKINVEFDKVVSSQPIHSADRAAAKAAGESFLALIPDAGATQDYYLAVSGWVSWNQEQVVIAANVSVSASQIGRAHV